MHPILINQWTNKKDCLREFLGEVIIDKRLALTDVRILVAYVSQQGLDELDPIIRKLRKRKGKVRAIFGYDPRITRINALERAIKLFPKGSLYIMGASNCAFHPKIYLLDGPRYRVAIIGSNNLTIGGLIKNWEASIAIITDTRNDKLMVEQLDNLWNSYFSYRGSHLSKLNLQWIKKNKGKLIDAEIAQTKSRPKRVSSPFKPIGTSYRLRKILSHPPILPTKGSKVPISLLPNTLFMQVLRETGSDGTQVQVPVDALEEYFGIDKDRTIPITIRINTYDFQANITHFPNNTHRIQMSFLAGTKRPLLLQLKRVPGNRDVYEGSIVLQTDPAYRRLLRKCNRQTRTGSKKYAIVP